MRAIIVDDEQDMRMILRKALEKIGDIEILGEAADGNAATELLAELRPDCVFMDVEMPGGDGVEAARSMLDIEPKLKIVFITAHQEYMPQAFELYAFDYMVKPFKLERLRETVTRLKDAAAAKASDEALYFKTKDGAVMLMPDEIFIVQRENRQTVIVTNASKHVVQETLAEVEEILPGHIFLRSHKSYIINIQHIKSVLAYGRWTYVVKFHIIKEDALMNREKAKELEGLLKTCKTHF